ncbi:MAG: nitrous oxide-stimulated promoter family protein [Desulfuromonas sp.]|nr:MAG: nitrous oxide-stimulated promoter family protein [Desulfuromonas sp.]
MASESEATEVLPLSPQEVKDLKVLALFTSVWCKAKHQGDKDVLEGLEPQLAKAVGHYHLCSDCREFLSYAFARRIRCPLDPKPTCKHCSLHCYRPGHREQVREIMRFSGKYLILRGRLDLLWHYFF